MAMGHKACLGRPSGARPTPCLYTSFSDRLRPPATVSEKSQVQPCLGWLSGARQTPFPYTSLSDHLRSPATVAEGAQSPKHKVQTHIALGMVEFLKTCRPIGVNILSGLTCAASFDCATPSGKISCDSDFGGPTCTTLTLGRSRVRVACSSSMTLVLAFAWRGGRGASRPPGLEGQHRRTSQHTYRFPNRTVSKHSDHKLPQVGCAFSESLEIRDSRGKSCLSAESTRHRPFQR